jgi:hypothetical protein
MDIAGAKALKERLGHQARDEDPSPSPDVSEDAPPVYHYLGVADSPGTSDAAPADAPAEEGRSLLRRLRLVR